ncbi:MAG: ArsR/SmtB family transcription factor [Candidatus Aenigmatarchaeota archaeon]
MLEILGSKKRLEILKILSRRDMYVSEIMEKLHMDGKRAKHHLKKLEEADLVETYRKGRRRYYSLNKEIHLEITPPPEGKFLVYTSE